MCLGENEWIRAALKPAVEIIVPCKNPLRSSTVCVCFSFCRDRDKVDPVHRFVSVPSDLRCRHSHCVQHEVLRAWWCTGQVLQFQKKERAMKPNHGIDEVPETDEPTLRLAEGSQSADEFINELWYQNCSIQLIHLEDKPTRKIVQISWGWHEIFWLHNLFQARGIAKKVKEWLRSTLTSSDTMGLVNRMMKETKNG